MSKPVTSISAENIASQAAQARNLQRARLDQQRKQEAQKKMYTQKIAGQIQKGRVAPQKTDAQKKQALNGKRSFLAKQTQKRKMAGLQKQKIKSLQKIIKKYEKTLWFLLYTAAFADELFDVLPVPFLAQVLSLSSSAYINFALWNIGSPKTRKIDRIKRAGLVIIDIVPFINYLPTTIIMLYTVKKREEERYKKAKKQLAKISQ